MERSLEVWRRSLESQRSIKIKEFKMDRVKIARELVKVDDDVRYLEMEDELDNIDSRLSKLDRDLHRDGLLTIFRRV